MDRQSMVMVYKALQCSERANGRPLKKDKKAIEKLSSLSGRTEEEVKESLDKWVERGEVICAIPLNDTSLYYATEKFAKLHPELFSKDELEEAKNETASQSVDLFDSPFSAEVDSPFPDAVRTVSIRPERKKDNDESAQRRRAFIIAEEAKKKIRLAGKVTILDVKPIIALLNDGVSMDELRELFDWTLTDKFYSQLPIRARFSSAAYEAWQLSKFKRDDRNKNKYRWEEGKEFRLTDEGHLVKCNPRTGAIIVDNNGTEIPGTNLI